MNTLKLNALESSSLSKKEMNLINGGNRACVCACNYEGQEGGSSRVDNGKAMFKMRHLYINLGVLFFSLFLFPSETHAQTGSGSMMIMGDIDANQFKNLTFNLIPSPAPRNYGTRVAIDTSRLSVTYRYTITEPDSLEATVIDMQALEIGDMLNRFYSRYGEFRDSIMYENHLDFLRTGNEVGVRPDFKKSEHPVYCDVFTYPGENTRLVSERYVKTDYQYTEEVTPIEWQLSSEQEVILGYNCQRATGTTARGSSEGCRA